MSSHQEWEDVLTVEMDLTKEMSGEQLNEEVEANPFQESQLTTGACTQLWNLPTSHQLVHMF